MQEKENCTSLRFALDCYSHNALMRPYTTNIRNKTFCPYNYVNRSFVSNYYFFNVKTTSLIRFAVLSLTCRKASLADSDFSISKACVVSLTYYLTAATHTNMSQT